MPASILDQVISSQKMSAISQFDPETVVSKIFGILTDREQDILIKRYGLGGQGKITLEEIGKNYSVTRERIRQVENTSLNKIREEFAQSILKDLEFLIRTILEDHGDLMSEDRLIESVLVAENMNPSNEALMRFMLEQLLIKQLKLAQESAHIYKAWSTPNASWDRFDSIIKELIKIVEKHGEPLKFNALMEQARRDIKFEDELANKFDSIVTNYLDVTKKVEENRFNEWGLSHWNTIRPRRMNDKIHLIMKKEDKPLHFSDIATKINEVQFDKRIAYPATIHNELILDPKYVLVGRGIYALKEWGYKPGIVLDVIRDILRQSAKSLSRDEIITEVLKSRIVKKSTVILALMNKKHFTKDNDGKYSLPK